MFLVIPERDKNTANNVNRELFTLHDIFPLIGPTELQEQLDRAMRLEEERRRAEQEAARLETERMEAIIAKEELCRQAEDQIRSQEQLVSIHTARRPRTAASAV